MPLLIAALMLSGWLSANHFSPWVSWHSELPFFVAAVVVALHLAWRRGMAVTLPAATALPLLLGATVAVQTALQQITWTGQAAVIALYLALVIVALCWGAKEGWAARLPNSGAREGEWLAWALIVVSVASVAVALLQVLQQYEGISLIAPPSFDRRPGGNLGQPNHLATLLLMGCGAALFLHLRSRLGAATLTLLTGFLIVGLVVSESRTGLLGMLALCIFWFWKRPPIDRAVPRRWAWMPLAFTAMCFVLWPPFYLAWSGGMDDGTLGARRLADSGGDPRLVLWRQMVDASLQHPWFGWGVRDTAEAQNAVAHFGGSTLPITYSHNVLVDLLVWVGWPLTVVMVLMVAGWFWRRWSLIQRDALTWFGMALLLPFGIHSLLEFPFAYAYLLWPAMLGAGYIDGAAPAPARPRPSRAVVRLAAGIFAVIGAWSAYEYVQIEEDFRVARFELLRIGSAPVDPPPAILLLDQMSELTASTRIPLQPGLSSEQMGVLDRAARHYPWTGSQQRYAAALALNGDVPGARRQLRIIWAQHGDDVYRSMLRQVNVELHRHQQDTLDMDLAPP